MRKPNDLEVKTALGCKTTHAWCERNQEGDRVIGTEFICDVSLEEAKRLRSWLDKAIAWMEEAA